MKCLYFVSEQTRRVFNNLLDYKMRDKNICIFAGMSNERDDPGTLDPHLNQSLPDVIPEQTGSLSHFIFISSHAEKQQMKLNSFQIKYGLFSSGI